MRNRVIECSGLTRRFGPVLAVDRLDLTVEQGSVYAFLGPNGAGKTTTIRMLLGLIRPNSGHVRILGRDMPAQRLDILKRVGALVEAPSLYPHLTGRENLEVIRRLTGGTRFDVDRALRLVRLQGEAHRLVSHYSQGMRQRLGLAVAYIQYPQLLILDEPTNGLDPAGIHEVRDLIRELPNQEGVTVFLSSHLLNEVEQVATHVGIVQQGEMRFQGTLEELRARYQDHLSVKTDRLAESQQLLASLGWSAGQNGNGHLVVGVNGPSDVAMINTQLVRAGHQVYGLNLAQPSLEDIFLALTNGQLDGGVK